VHDSFNDSCDAGGRVKRIIGRQCKTKPREPMSLDGAAANDAPVVEERVVLPSGFEAIVELPRFKPNGLGEVDITEAARYIGWCRRKLHDRIRDGLPHPPYRVRAGKLYFQLDEIHAWAMEEAA
jgi:hypothetical protein